MRFSGYRVKWAWPFGAC